MLTEWKLLLWLDHNFMQVDFTLIPTSGGCRANIIKLSRSATDSYETRKRKKKKQDVFVGKSSYYSKNRMIIISFASFSYYFSCRLLDVVFLIFVTMYTDIFIKICRFLSSIFLPNLLFFGLSLATKQFAEWI